MTVTDKIAMWAAAVASLTFLTGIAALVFTRAANAINKAASIRQIEVAERELYLSLVERRMVWMAEYEAAFIGRQIEWRQQANSYLTRVAMEAPFERKLLRLLSEAGWLFDGEVVGLLSQIDAMQHRAHNACWEHVDGGLEQLTMNESGPDAQWIDLSHQMFGRLSEYMVKFLYVGDIQRKNSH